MQFDRRAMVGGAAALAASLAATPVLAARKTAPFNPGSGPRSRMVYVNDLSGDIDGLFATAHALMSPTCQLRCIVGTPAMFAAETAAVSAALGEEIVGLMGMKGQIPCHAGSSGKIGTGRVAQRSPGVQAIIDEAMRTDTDLPLYIAVGAGLTEVASAVLIEPKVAERATLVWIGGGSWPDGIKNEYNFGLDTDAARFLFNDTAMPIWQVPQSVYATCLISAAELRTMVAPHGRIGDWLYRKYTGFPEAFAKLIPIRINLGETWAMGDSPLVVLTSLGDSLPSFENGKVAYDRTSAGRYDEVICPTLNRDGTFTARSEGRKIRIYKDIDTRLMFGDFFAKLALNYPAK